MTQTITDQIEARHPSITASFVCSIFRRIHAARHPILADYTRDEVYGNGDKMAPGALYLAAEMTRSMTLVPGDRVLDLGCGKGDTSIFLSRHFGVRVAALDSWITEGFLREKFVSKGYGGQIVPYNLDVTRALPFDDAYFDAVFCMQAFHSFGGSVRFLKHLLRHLKPGGQICVAGTCFNEELEDGVVPDVYRDTDGWDAEYTKYHSPGWWQTLFEKQSLLDVTQCYELDNGLAMWEDVILYGSERAGESQEWFEKGQWLIRQLVHSRGHRPYLTHFVLSARKRRPEE